MTTPSPLADPARARRILGAAAILAAVLIPAPSRAVTLDNTVTRDMCVSCGCLDGYNGCDCGADRRKLACLKNGGPSMTLWHTPVPRSTLRPKDRPSKPVTRQVRRD